MKRIKIFTERLQRGLRQLWHRDIWHLWPSAPLNWRYFLPGQSTAIRLHRKLWWHSRYKLPGLLWLPLESARWLHWRVWASHRRIKSALASYGMEVEARFGIPVTQQRNRIEYWAKTWCIDPYTAYDWQLYRPDTDGLAIIYDNQTSAYHAMQNRKTGATNADHRLLGDKIALAERLSAQGIPMVQTVRATRGDWQDLEAALNRHPKLFCKLRSGNQGESAFAVWRGDHGLQGLAHDGKNLLDEQAVRQAWQQLTGKGDVLIQPFLVNHPCLAMAAADDVAITVRVVSRTTPEGFLIWWSELQVPEVVRLDAKRGFWCFPVAVAMGYLRPIPSNSLLTHEWKSNSDAIWALLSKTQQVPFWQELCSFSIQAHSALPNVWAIAWDWVITSDGPMLLEGNGGWGVESAQCQGLNFIAMDLSELE